MHTTLNLRSQFMLDPEVIFFNHGSFGARPCVVFEAEQHWRRVYERQPCSFGRDYGDAIHEARQRLAEYIGASVDNLVYVVNATTGINIVARSLCLQPGDQVLSTDHEYGAINKTWAFNCAKSGAEFVRQPIPMPVESATQVVEAIWAGVTDRTRVLAFSHITSPTAWVLPARELVRRAREAGIVTVVDGAHAPGQIPLALDEMGVDYYTGNCHKWLFSPPGSAFLYARPEMQDRLEPLIVSHGWGNDRPHITRFVDEQQMQGTRDLSAFLSVPTAIQFVQEHDWDAVRDRCHELLRYARQELCAWSGLEPLTPDSEAWYAQMAALPIPPCDRMALKEWLYDEYTIEIPIIGWGEHTLARLSVQGYNTRKEVETLIGALRRFFA